MSSTRRTSALNGSTQRRARVGVVGLGYVGLPLAVEFARAGLSAPRHRSRRAQDRRDRPRRILHSGRPDRPTCARSSTRAGCGDERLRRRGGSRHDQHLRADAAAQDEGPGHVLHRVGGRAIAEHLHPGMLVVLESTTYPGTTEELVQPMLEPAGLKAGVDFFLAFSPERVDPGNPTFNTRNVPKVVGGVSPDSTELAARALSDRDRHDRRGQLAAGRGDGEAAREHVPRGEHRAGQRDGADVRPPRHRRLGSGRRGARPSRSASCRSIPGPGLGGHCIPIDPFYLSWKAKQTGFEPRFIELAGQVNGAMPHASVDKIADALNVQQKALNGSRVLVARHRLQARHRRHARIAGARRHGRCCTRRARASRTPIRTCRRSPARAWRRRLRPRGGADHAGGAEPTPTASRSSPITARSTTTMVAAGAADRRHAQRDQAGASARVQARRAAPDACRTLAAGRRVEPTA